MTREETIQKIWNYVNHADEGLGLSAYEEFEENFNFILLELAKQDEILSKTYDDFVKSDLRLMKQYEENAELNKQLENSIPKSVIREKIEDLKDCMEEEEKKVFRKNMDWLCCQYTIRTLNRLLEGDKHE